MKFGRSLSFIKQIFKENDSLDECSKLCSLRAKILGCILLLFAVSFVVSLYGMWDYHRDRFMDMTKHEASQASLAIEAGLRASMLKNDRQALQTTIDDMVRVTKLTRINILKSDGRVALSSDSRMPGKMFGDGEFGDELRSAMLISDSEGDFWRNVIKVENRPACYECHSAEKKICGVLVVDASLADMYSILRNAAERFLITGILTFIIITLVLTKVINVFVLDPLRALRTGFGKVGKGDFEYWVDIKGCGELAEMGDSFNIMSRAIGRYIKEVGRKTGEFEMLYAIVRKMSETIELRRVMEIVVNILHEVVQAKCVMLAVANEQDSNRFELTWRKSSDRRCFWADYNMAEGDLPHDSICQEDLLEWQKGMLDVPFFSDEEQRVILPLALKNMRFGMICIVKESYDRFTHVDKNLFPSLAQHIAISIANARLYNQAITDELTSLYTKRYFFVKSKEMLDAAKAEGKGFCLLMLDLDHFKEVNDTYGHPVGDRVLASIGELIWLGVRRSDAPCRFGGEEFAVLLPGVGLPEAQTVADRLLGYIGGFDFVVDKNTTIRKTISIGIAAFPEHADNVEHLVAAADNALYEAKRLGRNQVRVYTGQAST